MTSDSHLERAAALLQRCDDPELDLEVRQYLVHAAQAHSLLSIGSFLAALMSSPESDDPIVVRGGGQGMSHGLES